MDDIVLGIIWLGAFSMVVLTVYFIMKFRAIAPERSYVKVKGEPRDWQKPGIVCLGLGIGIFISGIIPSIPNIRINELMQIGVMVISTGIGLIAAQQLDKKKSTEE